MSKTLFILDASGYLYRSYHALLGMKNARGEPTNALFGFIRSIHKIIQTFSPLYCVAVFDGPKSLTKRRALYADYKSHRLAMPEDLRVQRDWVMQFCELSGIPLLSLPEVEADDTMASVALWAAQEGAHVFLCTSDKDMAQLVSPQIQLMNPSREHEVIGENDIPKLYGVRPDQIGDLLALTGDASDHIPGVPGCGPKTATALIQEFGSLDNILKQAETMQGKRGEMLRTHADTARLSRALVTLHCDVPFSHEWSFFHMRPQDKEGLQQLYHTMQFRSLLEKIAPTKSASEEQIPALSTLLIQDEATLENLVQRLICCPALCIHTESLPTHPTIEAPLIGIALTTAPTQTADDANSLSPNAPPHEAWYIPFNGAFDREYLQQHLQGLFSNPHIQWIGHNIKQDAHVMARAGLPLSSIGFDTLIVSSLLRAQGTEQTLESLASAFLDHPYSSLADLAEPTKRGKKAIPLDQIPLPVMAVSCGTKVWCIRLLKERFARELQERHMQALFHDIELPLLSVLLRMEQRGIFVDLEKLALLRDMLQKRLKLCEEEIYEHAGERFTINSPKQLSAILFGKHQLAPVRKTATGFSTDADVLESLAEVSPLARAILKYRTLEKLRSTYVDALPIEISPRTGRIHPTFQQSIVATGRLSCQNPNLQNIPIRSEEGRMIRGAFRPENPSWFYLSADYSQIELRFLAHFSQDEALLEAFATGRDVHTHTASLILQKPMSEVTAAERQSVKAVNFGIIYGQQAFGLAKILGIPQKQAAQFIELYFQRYPKVQGYIRSSVERARKEGFAITLCGRQRPLPEIHSANAAVRGAAERLAMNTPLQGSAADLIKIAMIAIDRYCLLHKRRTGMIAQIHDELLFEGPQEELKEMQAVIKQEMEHAMHLSVPLLVDIHVGKNWQEC